MQHVGYCVAITLVRFGVLWIHVYLVCTRNKIYTEYTAQLLKWLMNDVYHKKRFKSPHLTRTALRLSCIIMLNRTMGAGRNF